jgi:hypothetical protein
MHPLATLTAQRRTADASSARTIVQSMRVICAPLVSMQENPWMMRGLPVAFTPKRSEPVK